MEISFSTELKKLRLAAGCATKELSKAVGKAETYISQIENGKIKKPNYNTFYLILKELGVKEGDIQDYLKVFGIIPKSRNEKKLHEHIRIVLKNRKIEHKDSDKSTDVTVDYSTILNSIKEGILKHNREMFIASAMLQGRISEHSRSKDIEMVISSKVEQMAYNVLAALTKELGFKVYSDGKKIDM